MQANCRYFSSSSSHIPVHSFRYNFKYALWILMDFIKILKDGYLFLTECLNLQVVVLG